MRENKFTPEEFFPDDKVYEDEEKFDKHLEKMTKQARENIRAAAKTRSFQELVKTAREEALKDVLEDYNIIRSYERQFEQKHQQELKELKKDVESGDYELAAARFEGWYKTLQMVLGNLKQQTKKLEDETKRYWAKEAEYLRLKHPSKEK